MYQSHLENTRVHDKPRARQVCYHCPGCERTKAWTRRAHQRGQALRTGPGASLAADSYFILAGSGSQDGAVLTRDRDHVAATRRLPATGDPWYLIQFNTDHGAEEPADDRRSRVAARYLRRYGPANFTREALWGLLSDDRADAGAGERGVLNEETVFSAMFAQPDRGEAVLRLEVRQPGARRPAAAAA